LVSPSSPLGWGGNIDTPGYQFFPLSLRAAGVDSHLYLMKDSESNRKTILMTRRNRVDQQPAGDKFIGMRKVQRRYNDVSHMTIERRLQNDPAFPRPIRFGHLRMWRVSDLEAYERSLVAKLA
jgi:hypothetical protein